MPFSEKTKLIVKKQAAFRCCRCHEIGIDVHHITPQSERATYEGNIDDIENAAPLCQNCHDRFGANPEKRKEIKQLRDWWYEIVVERYSGRYFDNDIEKLIDSRVEEKINEKLLVGNQKSLKKQDEMGIVYADIPKAHWAYSYIQHCYERRIFNPSAFFSPDKYLSRAELSEYMFKVAQYVGIITDFDITDAPRFDDVLENQWFYPYVSTLVKYGLLSGYKDMVGNLTGKFGPNDLVTNAQAVKVFINAGGVPNYTYPTAPFSDLVKDAWYMDYVSTAYNRSIIDGDMNGYFYPNDPIDRANTAKIIYGALNPRDRFK